MLQSVVQVRLLEFLCYGLVLGRQDSCPHASRNAPSRFWPNMDSWISTVFPWPPSLISPCWIFKEQISLSFWSDVMTVRSDKPVRRDTLLLDSSMDHRKMMNSHCTSRSLQFSKKEPALIDRRSFSNVLYIPSEIHPLILTFRVRPCQFRSDTDA